MNDIKQKLINAINVQGIFLQEKCSSIFEKNGWNVVTEYPIIFPKPSFGGLGKECVADIWTRKSFSNTDIDFLVECKKADPKLKNWIFFEDKFVYPIGNAQVKFSKNSEGRWITQTALIDIQTYILKLLSLQNNVRCFFGLEVKEKFEKSQQKEDARSSTQRISDACYQAVQATNGTFQEYGEYYSKLQSTELPKNDTTHLVLPLVITTANLFIVKYELDRVSGEGILDVDNVSFEEKNVVLYNYPVPGHIRFPILEVDIPKRKLSDRLGYKKTLVLILKESYLKEFLEKFN